jgi:sigma-B regulation protein RsbU (phosphoserine phosphatase)
VVEASGKDEVGDLAKAFNTMTRKLSRSMEALQKSEKELIQHRDHLEVLVGERTASLEAANRRMNKDLASAAQVQRTFLPQKPPEVPGVRFAWNFTPCEKLAGDMLDISWVDSRHVGIWVADVCGHGVAAALVSVILSRLLSSLHQSDNSMLAQADGAEGNGTIAPSDIAEFLNERFSCDPETMRYFTFLYGLLDVKTREFRYVSAGHPGPLLVPVEGEARILPMSPPAIGILPSPHFIEHRVTLEAGSRLYLYTDGVTETSDKHEEEFGENQLSRIMMEYRSLSLQESVDALLLDLAKWRDGANPADDISLVAVELE